MNKPKLTFTELFSGTGMQRRGFENSELFDLEVIATSDIDKDAIVAYATVHCGLNDEMIENYPQYPSREKMVEQLKSRNIGMDFEKNKMFAWEKLIKKKTNDLEKYWLAMTLQNNLGDISKIEQLPLSDFWFYSFCCQDISLAGKQKGLKTVCNSCGYEFNPMELELEYRDKCPNCDSTDIKGSRSGLLKEVERLLIKSIETNTMPKYLCLENVKNLVGKKFKDDFDLWIKKLEELGYNTKWAILNGKTCGVPQNRERVFALSIRKNIDTGKFTFPLPFDNGLRLKDILEKNVDEKYYIQTERAQNLIQQLIDKGQLKGQREDESQSVLVKNQATEYTRTVDTANTLMARDWKGYGNQDMIAIVESEKIDEQKRLGGMFDDKTKHQAGSVWDTNGLAPTLDTMAGGLRQPCIVENKPKERFFKQAIETFNNNDCEEGDTIDAFNRRVNKSGYCPTLTTRPEGFKTAILPVVKDDSEEVSVPKRKARTFDFDECKPICVGNTTPSGRSQCNAVYSTEGISQTLCAGTHGYATGSILEETNNINVVGNYMPSNHDASRVVSTEGVAPCVKENHGTVTGIVEEQPEVIGIKQATKKGYIECELPGCADFSFPNSTKRRGRVQGNGQIVPTLTAAEGGIRYIESIYRIRKLTPKECWVLMGMTFEDAQKCTDIGLSNSALYKIAGNGICTQCIELIAEHLYKAQYDESYICTDEKMQNFQKPETE